MRVGWSVIGLALMASLAAAQSGTGLGSYPAPPATEPFRETVFDRAIDDPYRWMKRADRQPEVERWIDASSRAARRAAARAACWCRWPCSSGPTCSPPR
ncbi:hypothetical protein [Sphingomonas bacterium]|uniref:hypothetical protein n=1 Tax=Sphingomonas bacterium TaxID=1895847 RepID=UPI0015750703|nr:hypothetical protein [Sphingomonas bacterium]